MGQLKAPCLKLKVQIGFFISSFVYLFISSLLVHATVVLNEVAVQPNQVVELINTSTSSADISGWYIDDSGGTTYFTVPQQTVLAPLSCYVSTADFNFNKSSSDIIRLFDSSHPPTTVSAKLIESYSYSKAPDSSYSFSKKTDGGNEWTTSSSSLGLFNETLSSCIPTLTPTPTPYPTEPPTPLPSPTSPAEVVNEGGTPMDYSNILISEVFPYPSVNGYEWIELYNNNKDKVCLEKWFIDDGENAGSTPKQVSLCLESYSYGAVDIISSLFNNSGDTARLLNAEKTEKDSMEYGKVTEGKSIGRTTFETDEYCEQEPSKNTVNNSCIAEDTSSPKSQVTTQITSRTKNSKIPTPISSTQMLGPLSSSLNSIHSSPTPQKGVVLGAGSEETAPTTPYTLTPIPYLSSVSFSYSLLTIVSIFIKMRNA